MIDILTKIWEIIKDADERLGFKKILMYTTYILVVVAFLNWKSILAEVNSHLKQIERENHDKDLEIRNKISSEVRPYLVGLRIKSGADRVYLFEFHNSVTSLIGIPFKYVGLSSHDEPYGAQMEVPCSDVNSEVIGNFIRKLQEEMFCEFDNLEILRNSDPLVAKRLNDPNAISACYQYMSVLGKPLGIIVLEYHNPESVTTPVVWKRVRSLCSQATQDLNSIILKYKG